MSILTTIENKLRSAEPEVEDLIAFLHVVDAAVDGGAAAVGLDMVAAAYKALAGKASGTLTHADFLNQIAEAQQGMATDRAAEDAELAAKFPEGA